MTPEAFHAFARSLPEPMALTDERGRVVASNPAARDFVVALRHGTSVCDLSVRDQRERLVGEVAERFGGKLDILVSWNQLLTRVRFLDPIYLLEM
jgi:NAD(P)-dependent dehydrogenase (short-subunit alcohol dehydrogenase family)